MAHRWSVHTHFTKIDLSMMHYDFELDEESKELCTIVTAFGKFQCCRMAMGLKTSPDIAQSVIEHVNRPCDVGKHLNDVGSFDTTCDDHMERIEKVSTASQENRFKANPDKCEWCAQEMDFLGHWLTPDGVKLWKKKAEVVLQLSVPAIWTQLRSFWAPWTITRMFGLDHHTFWPL